MTPIAAWMALVILILCAGGIALSLVAHNGRVRPEVPPVPEMPVETIDVDGWSFRYHLSGAGPHILLLHGIGANLFCWRQITPLLSLHFTVIAVDLPGFGGSSKPVGARYGLDDQLPRLEAFLDRLKVGRTFVVGNSMGGNLALWMALRRPMRVLGCAVIAPATSPSLMPMSLKDWAWISRPLSLALTRPTMRWAHRRTVSRPDLVDARRVEDTYRTYSRKPEAVRSFMLATDAIRDPRLPTALTALTWPVLILWGSRDRLVGRKIIDQLESALGASESHVHIGGGHHLQEDEPDWVCTRLLAFFLVRPD